MIANERHCNTGRKLPGTAVHTGHLETVYSLQLLLQCAPKMKWKIVTKIAKIRGLKFLTSFCHQYGTVVTSLI